MNNNIVDTLKDMTLNHEKEKDVTQEASNSQISCDFCGKYFWSKSGLTRDINAVHQDRKYSQRICLSMSFVGKLCPLDQV